MSLMPVMSINSDTAHAYGRDDQAKLAGHVIYSSIHQESRAPLIPPPVASAEAVPALVPPIVPVTMDTSIIGMAEGKISSVRRTFCLFVLFDLILMFILWVIYTQLIGDTGYKAFEKQVKDYDFKTSLFDTVMLSAVRFTFLMLAYALFRIRHWWTIAICTALSCGVLIAKIFLFDFTGTHSTNNPLSYCLIIISFVLAWAETWFLDFKVLPQEKKALEKLAYVQGRGYGSTMIGHRSRPVGHDDLQSVMTEDNQFYSPLDSPLDSPEGSDTEERHDRGSDYRSVRSSRTLTRQDNDYGRLAQHAWEVLWTYMTSPESDWKLESGQDIFSGVVHSKKVKEIGKIFRLQGIVDMPARDLYEEVTYKPETQSHWNAAIKEGKVLQVVDSHTDILYNIAAEIAGGVITSRDFVSLRRWGEREGVFIGAGLGVNHPDMPPQKNYIRGTNGVGGMVYKPFPEDATKTLFCWYMNTDIKGWFPQKLIDANMAKVLLDFIKDLRAHVESIKSDRMSSYSV